MNNWQIYLDIILVIFICFLLFENFHKGSQIKGAYNNLDILRTEIKSLGDYKSKIHNIHENYHKECREMNKEYGDDISNQFKRYVEGLNTIQQKFVDSVINVVKNAK